MRLSYIDESETADGEVYLFGALICDPAQAVGIEQGISYEAKQFHAANSDALPADFEIHACEVFHGRGHWRNVPQGDRFDLLEAVVDTVVAESPQYIVRGINEPNYRAKYKSRMFPVHEQAMGYLFEQIETQMERFFNEEKVIAFADEHHAGPNARANLKSARGHAIRGKISKPLDHFLDTVYFGPSSHSALLQSVDVCTYFYQRGVYGAPATQAWKQRRIDTITEKVCDLVTFEHIWL